MGLLRPRAGSILFKGREIACLPPFRVARAGIGYVPEERRIFPELNVVDNLQIGVKGGKIGKASNGTKWTIERIFQHFPKLKERANSKGRFLSGGEQQMLTIGRSLMGNPELLLVDEPTEGLSPIMVQEVRDILEEINKAGVSILLVEHNFKVAMSLANRVYLMGKAHVGFTGTKEDLDANPQAREKYMEV
jgi:branched-chain amino acid transport system ATP-binding protein